MGVYALGNPHPTQQELYWGEAEAYTIAKLANQLRLVGEVKAAAEPGRVRHPRRLRRHPAGPGGSGGARRVRGARAGAGGRVPDVGRVVPRALRRVRRAVPGAGRRAAGRAAGPRHHRVQVPAVAGRGPGRHARANRGGRAAVRRGDPVVRPERARRRGGPADPARCVRVHQ